MRQRPSTDVSRFLSDPQKLRLPDSVLVHLHQRIGRAETLISTNGVLNLCQVAHSNVWTMSVQTGGRLASTQGNYWATGRHRTRARSYPAAEPTVQPRFGSEVLSSSSDALRYGLGTSKKSQRRDDFDAVRVVYDWRHHRYVDDLHRATILLNRYSAKKSHPHRNEHHAASL